MSQPDPFAFRWISEQKAMVPLRPQAAARAYIDGRIYWLVETKDNKFGSPSWRHQWAVLGKAWANLPESLSGYYQNPDALRKRSLIEAGYYDETTMEVGDEASAGRVVQSLRRKDPLSHVRIENGLVFQRTARSQKDMSPEEFEDSKNAIFIVIAELLGITVDELTRQGEL